MPVVFSPGEPETRPLDPTAIVYTTAQKVADFLAIGPQDAVLVAADSVSDGVYVTGADYRTIGFEVGDTIFIYSDADPLGLEKTITAISNGGASGVKLAFTGGFTHADYQAADNAYVQNTSSFSNGAVGRQRGMTKAIVEARIKETQDKIDNITHNAWRPYLVSAEYINFDTYKPYRRRYYTDYVGTTPLLFRNVQQMLRIELWQGDDYREIASAEARIKIPEDVRAISGSIVVSPGNGSAAVLTAGSSTSQWRADFDAATTAQNLSDLINKEDRVSKAAVEFASAFTLEGSTSNVAVHNEFLASANADYGTGVVKLTSMRAVKGGESCSIVVTDSSVTLSQTQVNTATVSNATTTVLTVDSTSGFASAGVLSVGDTAIRYTGKTATTFTGCASVVGSSVDDLNGLTLTQHLLQVDLQGGSSSGDVGRLRDWWLDHEEGIVYFNNSYPFFEWNAVKVAYIYGERYLEKAIEEAATKMVAADLLMSDDRSVLIPEGTQNVDIGAKVQLLRQEAEAILRRYTEIVVFE